MPGHSPPAPDALPELISFSRSSDASKPMDAFRTHYRERLLRLREIFPPQENPQAVYPPDRADVFLQQYVAAPALHQNLSRELLTLLDEIEERGGVVNGKTLYDHQWGHLLWAALTLPRGRDAARSVSIEGAPGTGKTLTLGVLLQACVRLQMRGLLGAVAYATAKPYQLSSKVRGDSAGRARILRTPPYEFTERDVRRTYGSFVRIDRYFMRAYFPLAVWRQICAHRPASIETARRELLAHARDGLSLAHAVHDDAQAGMMLTNLAQILCGSATTVRGSGGKPELLSILPPPKDAGMTLNAFTGDAAYAIPRDYPVYARESVGIRTVSPEEAKVALVPASLFTSSLQIQTLGADLHRRIELVLCDEKQRRHHMSFQGPVLSAGAKEPPLVIAAGSQWYEGRGWEQRSPRHSFPESIRRGVLPSIGVRVFPSAEMPHYPSESQEGLDQLTEEFFRTLQYFEQLHLPQPARGNTLLVVHTRLVPIMIKRLRDEFRKRRKEDAQVYGFTGGDEDREALQLWFAEQRDGASVLVSSPAMVKDTLDFPAIRQLLIGARVTPDVLYHLIGRLLHGRDLRGPRDRLLVTQQQFSNSTLSATPFVVLDHRQSFPDDGFRWVPGHALLSEQAFRADARRTAGKERRLEAVTVPPSRRLRKGEESPITRADGAIMLVRPRMQDNEEYIPRRPVYDSTNGPPTPQVIDQWAELYGGKAFSRNFSGVLTVVAGEAYGRREDPEEAVKKKVAKLRERYGG
ncbi:MAG: hypothetical protein Greene041619_1200 [Candidatus Peregrinibacteria bacterium Greene0416_19]|nr:MAG: hypothetical protein Greene041619_1200 [Candidatus Peregrinibacteria bacterium Greene0416_19]